MKKSSISTLASITALTFTGCENKHPSLPPAATDNIPPKTLSIAQETTAQRTQEVIAPTFILEWPDKDIIRHAYGEILSENGSKKNINHIRDEDLPTICNILEETTNKENQINEKSVGQATFLIEEKGMVNTDLSFKNERFEEIMQNVITEYVSNLAKTHPHEGMLANEYLIQAINKEVILNEKGKKIVNHFYQRFSDPNFPLHLPIHIRPDDKIEIGDYTLPDTSSKAEHKTIQDTLVYILKNSGLSEEKAEKQAKSMVGTIKIVPKVATTPTQ